MGDMFINLAGAAGYGQPTGPEFLPEAFEQRAARLFFLAGMRWGREETEES